MYIVCPTIADLMAFLAANGKDKVEVFKVTEPDDATDSVQEEDRVLTVNYLGDIDLETLKQLANGGYTKIVWKAFTYTTDIAWARQQMYKKFGLRINVKKDAEGTYTMTVRDKNDSINVKKGVAGANIRTMRVGDVGIVKINWSEKQTRSRIYAEAKAAKKKVRTMKVNILIYYEVIA